MLIFSFIGQILTELFGETDNWPQLHEQTSLTFYASNNVCLQNNLKKEKLFERNNKDDSL